ncbi:L,D-transpeptidase family protein [Streptomyces fagopyri]|uniref:L,D-transpeptidase family protein n=1 Tax=Streptomyces fagopyri TaxID=2662397 RepID=A0A5Q0LMU4_9ACTN|nr:L,D-transpeptidase family protein [Streptomyces fagopyri]QFZ78360.1 L,D-transpeptidase family protein [Streptomyces fagopyri]
MPKNPSSGVRAALIGASALAALASGLMTAPSHAAAPTGPTPGRHGIPLADHTFSRIDPHTTLKFIRNRNNPRHSLLQVVRYGRVAVQFRAGSGAGLGERKDAGRNECASGKGWLPKGTYTVGTPDTRYNGDLIKGYAIPLSDKACTNGTKRTQLFIHSEMTRAGGQAPAVPGKDVRQRWDHDYDYESAGCIKLTPGNIKKLFRNLARFPLPTKLTVI